MVDYVNVKYDDKATGTEIIDDVDKENVNVEVVLNKPKNNKLKGKGKHGTSSVSFKGRKGSPSKKGSCSKSTKTKPCKVLKFFDDSSSDDHGSVFRASNVIKFYSDSSSDDHGSVFRGKPGSTSKGVGAPKHSRGKKSKGNRKMV
ncbi:hypothetical protein Tco_0801410 [Tanacetum coccineum]|uniref:Uncharacterized protein n=1 Tax=Tanacetum coccineum TaxID=301880 RepID=A0ABQ4ZWR3_9ASTR